MKEIEIVIIEDNLKVAKAHQLYVEKLPGYVVTGIINNLTDAMSMIETLQPDLILLDVYFPDGNGMDFLAQVRLRHADVDIILITAAKDVRLLHNALRGGVFDYMIKPVFFERFEEALNNYLKHYLQLHQLSEMSQEEADRFFIHGFQGVEKNMQGEYPKGIDPLTLDKIKAAVDNAPDNGLSADETGKIIGASRTTARKYLEFLISTGFLRVHIEYGTIGRPERRYYKT